MWLFSLQMPQLTWTNCKFDSFSFPLQFGTDADPLPPGMMRVEVVDVSVKGIAEPLHFHTSLTEDKQTTSLSLKPPQTGWPSLLQSASYELKLDVASSKPEATQSRLQATFSPYIKPMRDSVKTELEKVLNPIALWYKPPSPPTFLENLATELLSDRTPERSGPISAKLTKHINATAQELEAAADELSTSTEQQKIDKRKVLIGKLEIAKKQDEAFEGAKRLSEEYRRFRSNLKEANMERLLLHYDFSLPLPQQPSVKIPVRVKLEIQRAQ
jgi:hypothetical protein